MIGGVCYQSYIKSVRYKNNCSHLLNKIKIQIKAIDYASPLLKTRIKEIKQTIDITKKIIIGRYKKENIPLHKMIKMLLNSTNLVEEEIFKELITDRLIEKRNLFLWIC